MSPVRSIEILPGFSERNKDWAKKTKNDLEENGNFRANIVFWPHWESGSSEQGWIEREADKISFRIGKQTVDILAKSVGTMVAMEVLKRGAQVNRIILCGIPVEDFLEDGKSHYSALTDIDPNKIVIFQNDHDPHGSPAKVKKLTDEINSAIRIEVKKGNHHNYPYVEDFISFFT